MGTDCCGGAQEAPATPGLADLSLKSAPARPASAKKAANGAAPAKSHAECAAELQGFIAKRIKLFEEYAEREHTAVRILPRTAVCCNPLLTQATACLHHAAHQLCGLDQSTLLARIYIQSKVAARCSVPLTGAGYRWSHRSRAALRRWKRHARRTSPSQSRCRMERRCALGAGRRARFRSCGTLRKHTAGSGSLCSLVAALPSAQALPDTALQAPGAAAPDQRLLPPPAVTMSARLLCARHHKRAQCDRAAVCSRRAARHRRETGGAA
jgi:hypothetical protein